MCTGLLHAWTDWAVIRISYKDFSAGTHDVTGLHGRAERCAHGVTVYLIPGLTVCQRKAVIRRLRQEAGRGCGPELPLSQLAIALGLDRVRTAAGIARAIIRLHPVATLVPGAFVVAMMTLFVFAAADRADYASASSTPQEATAAGGISAQAAGQQLVRARVAALAAAAVAVTAVAGTACPGAAAAAGTGSGPRLAGRNHPAGRVPGPARPGAAQACLLTATSQQRGCPVTSLPAVPARPRHCRPPEDLPRSRNCPATCWTDCYRPGKTRGAALKGSAGFGDTA
jgi:hypothetical protein